MTTHNGNGSKLHDHPPRLLSATVDELPPKKTCKRCMGKGKVITNAGTGLIAPCKDCSKHKPTNQ